MMPILLAADDEVDFMIHGIFSYDFFGQNIDLCDTDFIEDAKKVPPPVEVTDYERIHKYVLKHPRPVTEEPVTTEEEPYE